MKLLRFLKRAVAAGTAARPLTTWSAECHSLLSLESRLAVEPSTLESIGEQVAEVINRNAQGVVKSATHIIATISDLDALGVADPRISRSLTLASAAGQLANLVMTGFVSADGYELDHEKRMRAAARAMAIVIRADQLLREATADNQQQIGIAVKRMWSALNRVCPQQQHFPSTPYLEQPAHV